MKTSTPARVARPGRCTREGEGTFGLVAVGHRDLVEATVTAPAPLVDSLAATPDVDAGADKTEADVEAMVPGMGGCGRGKHRGSKGGDGGSRDDGLAEHVSLAPVSGRPQWPSLHRQSPAARGAFKIRPLNRVSSTTW